VLGLILGEGKTTGRYQEAFDQSVVVACSLGSFGAGKLDRIRGVLANELASYNVAQHSIRQLTPFIQGIKPIGIAVRRSYFLKVAGLLSRRFDAPGYWHMCDAVRDPFARAYYRSLLGRYGICPIGNSRYTIRTLLGEDSGRELFIYPGYWSDRIASRPSTDQLRRTLGISKCQAVFAMVSRLVAEKAVDVVLEAFLRSTAFHSGSHLVVAGGPIDTDFVHRIRDRAQTKGRGRVHFLGEVDDVSSVYGLADVVINGRRNAEPFGITIVESLAAGKPVLAYRKGGPEETIVDGETGWLIDTPTFESYLGGLERVWGDRRTWKYMGEAAAQSGQAYSAAVQTRSYIQLIARGP
jgi:glycosyltransferase involved in cell wall biosynthesis